MSRRTLQIAVLACAVAALVVGIALSVRHASGRRGRARRRGPPAASTATATPPSGDPRDNPELVVDTTGPLLGGIRVDMSAPDARKRMGAVLRTLPFKSELMTVKVDANAKTSHAAALVSELGKIGAQRVALQTEGRSDLPKEIAVMPASQMPGAIECSVTAMALNDQSIAVWPAGGGDAKRQRKGPGGPDLARTRDVIKSDVAACESAAALFYGDDSVAWELTYAVGASILAADDEKKLGAIVLLEDPPTPGSAVKIGNPDAPYHFVPR